jgi:hypothetical protein
MPRPLPDFGPPPPPASVGRLSASQARKLRAALAAYFTADPAQRAAWEVRNLPRPVAAARRGRGARPGLGGLPDRARTRGVAHRLRCTPGPVRAAPESVHRQARRPATGVGLAAVHRDAWWRQRSQAGQRSAMGRDAALLPRPGIGHGLLLRGVARAERHVERLLRHLRLSAGCQPHPAVRPVRPRWTPTRSSSWAIPTAATGPSPSARSCRDRFAAVHASAAAPTDGESSAKTLRNTVFTYMIGEKGPCVRPAHALPGLRRDRPQAARRPHGHLSRDDGVHRRQRPHRLPDREKIRSIVPGRAPAGATRVDVGDDRRVIRDFFWLEVPAPGKQQEINATCRDNRVTVTTRGVSAAGVLLDSRLVDLGRPVELEVNGRSTKQRLRPALRVLCETMALRGDPAFAFSVRVPLSPRRTCEVVQTQQPGGQPAGSSGNGLFHHAAQVTALQARIQDRAEPPFPVGAGPFRCWHRRVME